MAQKTDAQLTTDANVIKNETDVGENTADRVGSHLIDQIDSKLNVDQLTREFNRTFVEALVFDKTEIFHTPFVQTTAINLTIGAGGLVDEASSMRFRMTADGVNPINFGPGFDYLYGITNGQILEAGTYEFYFLYTNGSVSVNVPGVTAEQSNATTLTAPEDFVAVADGETALDLSWTNVTNNEGYLIEFSTTGTTGWTVLETTAVDAVAATHTGLNPGDIRYYRIRTLGDGSVTLNSAPSEVISGQTESSGDVTAPTFTFLPANGNTTWPINRPIIITANEPIRNADGSNITDANVATRITLKETNSGGTNIAFSASIDSTKTIITITPTTTYGTNQVVYVAINNVEDSNGNEVTVAVSVTFTTTAFTFFNATSNFLSFGDILSTVFEGVDSVFKLRITINDPILTGSHFLIGKYSTTDNQRSFYFYYTGGDVFFSWARVGSGASRTIKWAGALSAGEHDLELAYDGSIDTNNGLDRCVLTVDGGTAGSKTLDFNTGVLSDIFNSTAQLSIGAGVNSSGSVTVALYYGYEAKDFMVLSAGDVVEINVPIIFTGTDTSGNGNDGTWG